MEGIPEGRQATFRAQPSQSSRPPMRPPAPAPHGAPPIRPPRANTRRIGPVMVDSDFGPYPRGVCKWYYHGYECKRVRQGRDCDFAHVRPDDFGR